MHAVGRESQAIPRPRDALPLRRQCQPPQLLGRQSRVVEAGSVLLIVIPAWFQRESRKPDRPEPENRRCISSWVLDLI